MCFHGNYQGCRGPKNVIKYCTKGDNYISSFDVAAKLQAQQGKRKFLGQQILEGKKLVKVVEENPELVLSFDNLQKSVNAWMVATYVPEEREVVCEWLYGPTGTGKTHKAWNDAKAVGDVYWKNVNKWWDGYNG